MTDTPSGKTEDGKQEGEVRTCPRCETTYEPGVVVCVPCRIDLRTGKLIHTDTDVQEITEEDPDPPEPTFFARMIDLGLILFPGLFRPVVLISSILLTCVGWGGMVLGWVMVFGFGVFITGIFIGGGALLIYMQGVALVMSGRFDTLAGALAEFSEIEWYVFLFLSFLPLIAILVIVKLSTS